MQKYFEYFRGRGNILRRRSIHIMSLSFEQRCLAYPTILKDQRLPAREHTFFCIDLGDDNLNEFLKILRKNHSEEIKDTLPSIQFVTIEELFEEIDRIHPPDNVYIDLSSLTRISIFHLLQKVYEKWYSKINLFVIYSYPKNYMYGHLQEPAFTVEAVYDLPKPTRGEKVCALVLPGFDIEYTNVSLVYLRAKTERKSEVRWYIPFPGKQYNFYERTMESHLIFLKNYRFTLYPQEELKLSFDRIRKEIQTHGSPVFIIPLGCRIICISVFLATVWARKEGRKVNILLPQTRRYESIRSEGYVEPLIGEMFHNVSILE